MSSLPLNKKDVGKMGFKEESVGLGMQSSSVRTGRNGGRGKDKAGDNQRAGRRKRGRFPGLREERGDDRARSPDLGSGEQGN